MIAEIADERTIHIFDVSQFDLYQIRRSGQIFRDPPCGVTEEAGRIVLRASGGVSSAALWEYFDLGTDYNEIKSELSQFPSLRAPIEAGGGIRILRQPFFETVISFIISANNNIKRFSKTLALIRERYGERLPDGGFAFPTADRLRAATEPEYAELGCGYRSAYLKKAVEKLASMDAGTLSRLPNDALFRELLSLPGVGPKVASCIMLFAGDFHRMDAVPVDTWIKKAFENIPDVERAEMLKSKYSGVAQQYIFFYIQHLGRSLGT